MGATRSAFGAIWGEARLPYVRGKLVDVALVLVAGLLILCAFGVTIITQIVETAGEELVRKLGGPASAAGQLGAGLELVASVAVSFVAFLFLYRFVPTVRVRLRDALAGALVACAGFNLAAIGFSIYIRSVRRLRRGLRLAQRRVRLPGGGVRRGRDTAARRGRRGRVARRHANRSPGRR